MSTTTLPSIRTIDVAMLAAGEVHLVRVENEEGVAALCALLDYLRERGLTVILEDSRETEPATIN